MTTKVKNLRYALVPGKPGLDFSAIELHNQIYQFRNEFWSEILFEIFGDRRKLTGDDFLRQDVIAVLLDQDEIIGLQTYTFFDLRLVSAREHSFVNRYFDQTFLRRLSTHNAHQVMSIEYFSIHPEWRSSLVGLSLGRVMLSLGLKVASEYRLDAAIAAARDDVPAAAMANEMGAECWTKSIPVFGCPTDLVVFFPQRVKPLKAMDELDLATKLWQGRLDYLVIPERTKLKISA